VAWYDFCSSLHSDETRPNTPDGDGQRRQIVMVYGRGATLKRTQKALGAPNPFLL